MIPPSSAKFFIEKWAECGLPLAKSLERLGLTEAEIDDEKFINSVMIAEAEAMTKLFRSSFDGAITDPRLAIQWLERTNGAVLSTEATTGALSDEWQSLVTLGVRKAING